MNRIEYLTARATQKQVYAKISQQIREKRAERVKAQIAFSIIMNSTQEKYNKKFVDAYNYQLDIWVELKDLRIKATMIIEEVKVLKQKCSIIYKESK